MPSISEQELQSVLSGETDRVEWKQSAHDSDIVKAVCALANDLSNSGSPGYVLIGISNDGAPTGQLGDREQLDKTQQSIASQLHSTKIVPTPTFDVTVNQVAGKDIIVLKVYPYAVPPAVAVNGTEYVRRGTTTRRATGADLARLRERRPENQKPFDLRRVAGATLQDLENLSLEAHHAAARASHDEETFPPLEQWLEIKELGRRSHQGFEPNATALLLFGKSPQSFFPGAQIEFVRYAGTEIDSPVSIKKSITGTLVDQLEGIWTQLEANNASVQGIAAGAMQSIYQLQYPVEVLRELARNMVQHRQYEATHAPNRVEWYEDRIEFYNPGGPFGHASEGAFGTHADYRNPTLTKWLVELGYVEQLGRGLRIVKRALEKAAQPPLEVETNGFTRIVVRRRV